MDIRDIPVPDIYKKSADFRFFIELIAAAFTAVQYDTENLSDLYDPLRCKEELLWMLGDTVGYKYDSRLPTAFNRLVILYFMSMIRNKGSKDGVTLAAEINLAQFRILNDGKEHNINYNRLDDTTIPVNSVYVNPNVDKGYIDIVYFSDKKPIDACIEYVRPLGMYTFQTAGVRYDARSKVSVDARLTDESNLGMSFGPTHVGHYRREDYARLQNVDHVSETQVDAYVHPRSDVYNRNSDYEGDTNFDTNPGYRALSSLQLCNNEHIVESLLGPIFSLGFGPDDVSVRYVSSEYTDPDNLYKDVYVGKQPITDRAWNLRHDRDAETAITPDWSDKPDVYTSEDTSTIVRPDPAVNPIMSQIGDAIHIATDGNVSTYTDVQVDNTIKTETISGDDE